MKVRKIENREQRTTNWSGGTTTELYLYPEDGSYQDRRFVCRISTALCRDAVSDFTILKGTRRLLMPLEGEVTLYHADGNVVHLVPGKVDTFDGGLLTRSEGVCRDFNLMLKDGARGEMKLQQLEAGESMYLLSECSFLGLYVVSGKGNLCGSAQNCSFAEHDFLLLKPEKSDEPMKLRVDSACRLILAVVQVTI